MHQQDLCPEPSWISQLRRFRICAVAVGLFRWPTCRSNMPTHSIIVGRVGFAAFDAVFPQSALWQLHLAGRGDNTFRATFVRK